MTSTAGAQGSCKIKCRSNASQKKVSHVSSLAVQPNEPGAGVPHCCRQSLVQRQRLVVSRNNEEGGETIGLKGEPTRRQPA
jgi:hypothetical protein